MAEVTCTPQGLDDLEAVCLFIARDSPRYAGLLAERLLEAADRLGDFPMMGRIVPEIGQDSIREVIVQSYRIIDLLTSDQVVILMVHHGGRPLDPGGR